MDRKEILRREAFNLLDSHFIWIGKQGKSATLQDYRLHPHYAKSMEDVANNIVALALEYKGESV